MDVEMTDRHGHGFLQDGYSVREHRTRIVASRMSPVLVFVDLDLNVISWSPDSGTEKMVAAAGPDLRDAVRDCSARGQQIIHVTDEDILLRIIPLQSVITPCVAIMVESFGHRGSLTHAAKAYKLTKREVEILGYVAQGASNAEIAKQLFIARSTVADHIKSLMRKTKTSKRIHLLSKIAYDDAV
jgi:DNA-binding NarL/FixJ family response regulator